jgi:predicted outer membrane repeat protein
MSMRRHSRPTARRRAPARQPTLRSRYRRHLRYEPLEDRRLLAVVTVNTLADTVDFNDGLTSLREAIFATNIVPGADTIDFASSLTASGPATILLTQGELMITDSLTINGPGAELLTIDASGSDATPGVADRQGSRIFKGDDGADARITVSISDLRLTGGDVSGSGGAITSAEDVYLTDVVVDQNAGEYSVIYSRGTLTIDRTRIINNQATGSISGVSIISAGALTIRASEVSSNLGIGVAIGGDSDTLISDTTISNNNGTGLLIKTSGNSQVVRSTISGNIGGWGGIWVNTFQGGSCLVSECAISANVGGQNGAGGAYFHAFLGGTVAVQRSTISFNHAPSGGGIKADGSIQILDCEFLGNTTTQFSGNGGGLLLTANTSGDQFVSGSTFRDNVAFHDGGAIYVERVSNVSRTVLLVGNSIITNTADNQGGGIAVVAAVGTVIVDTTTFHGNHAAVNGGGASIQAYGTSRVRVENSTINSNSTRTNGGGLAITTASLAEVLVQHSTISGNSAIGSGSGISITENGGSAILSNSTISFNGFGTSSGGGVSAMGNGNLQIRHTIIAGNVGASVSPDLRNTIVNAIVSYSFIGKSNGSGLSPAPVGAPDANGNLVGGTTSGTLIDPQLGPLADNGGPTLTHALLPGSSPAIDAGDPADIAGVNGVPLHDQRGAPFIRVYGGRIDIGAVESQPDTLLGDYNLNGIVDAADNALWRNTKGSTSDLRADGDGNGQVDNADYLVWRANFGEVRQSAGATSIVTTPALDASLPLETGALPVEPAAGVSPNFLPEQSLIASQSRSVTVEAIDLPLAPRTRDVASKHLRTLSERMIVQSDSAVDRLLAPSFAGSDSAPQSSLSFVRHEAERTDAGSDVSCDVATAALDEAFATLSSRRELVRGV